MPTYTQNQTVFALSAAANLASCFEGTASEIEVALGSKLNSLLPQFQPQLGSWEVVWGPVVYVPPASDLSGNVMYVARGGSDTSSPGQLVVAIAGTNPYSAFDWIVEDAFVSTQVSWSTGNPSPGSAPKISLGTFLGLTILQAMVAAPVQPGAGSTLADFLTSQAGGCPLVTVTGHSLGGALAPAVALWLSDQGGIWNPRGAVGLSCLASAGPTPGNKDFAAYYDAKLQASTTRYWNAIDIVPHAWDETLLAEIPDLYEPQILPGLAVDLFVAVAKTIALLGGYTQISAATAPLPGTVNTSIISGTNTAFENFFVQMSYQHVDAYFSLLGVEELEAAWACVQASAVLASPTARAAAFLDRLERKVALSRSRVAP